MYLFALLGLAHRVGAVVPDAYFRLNTAQLKDLGYPMSLPLDGPRCLPVGGPRKDRGDASRIALHATPANLPMTMAFAILLKERLGFSPMLSNPGGMSINQRAAMFYLNGCDPSAHEVYEIFNLSVHRSFCAQSGPLDVSLEVMDNGGSYSDWGSIYLDSISNGTYSTVADSLSSQLGLYAGTASNTRAAPDLRARGAITTRAQHLSSLRATQLHPDRCRERQRDFGLVE